MEWGLLFTTKAEILFMFIHVYLVEQVSTPNHAMNKNVNVLHNYFNRATQMHDYM